MKSAFPEYISYSEAEFQLLWDNAIIVFDANTLLNFYRYSTETAEALREALSFYSERVWIPNQVGIEYFKNRLNVISAQKSNYSEPSKSLNSIKDTLSNKRGHPFITDDLLKAFESLVARIQINFESQKNALDELVLHDPFKTFIIELFDNKIGPSFSVEELSVIYKEGKSRYERKIPPGFGDTKPEPERYGDLVLWKQVLHKAKSEKLDVIFITDDEKKGDWSLFHSGKNLGPLPALRAEFNSTTGRAFHIYPAFRFLELAFKNKNKQININVIKEIKEVSEHFSKTLTDDEVKYYELTFSIDTKNSSKKDISKFHNELTNMGYHIDLLTDPANRSDSHDFNLRLPFEDLIRRFRNRLDELLIIFSWELINFRVDKFI